MRRQKFVPELTVNLVILGECRAQFLVGGNEKVGVGSDVSQDQVEILGRRLLL